MQLTAYVCVNGPASNRCVFSYLFDKGNVSDLCSFAAAKCSCPLGCSFKVSLKIPGDDHPWNVAPDIPLTDGSEMHIVIDPPKNDGSVFHLPSHPADGPFLRPAISQPQSGARGFSQSTLDASFSSFTEESFIPSSSVSTQKSLPPSETDANACEKPDDDGSFFDQINRIFAAPGSSTPPSNGSLSQNGLLIAVYFSQREEIEACYAAMKPAEPLAINKIDVVSFLDHPARKAALHILKNPKEKNMEVTAAAKYVCKKVLVELLQAAYPDYSCPSNAIKPVTDFLAQSTGNDWFLDLTTTNGTNLIMNAFRQRQKRFRQAQSPRDPSAPTTPGKKKKLVQHIDPEDLDAAAVALARCTSAKETKRIVIETAPLRCSWLKNLEQENALQIPETFIKKFPCFISDASLLNEDYKCNMQLRGLDPANFGEAFKAMIPAIFHLADAKGLLPPDSPLPTDSDVDAWIACKLLVLLVPKYVKRNTNCKPERLFLEGWDSGYLNVLHQRRRELKQTAPMIYVIRAYPTTSNTYYVAADDFALKVPGSFCDALQSLLELHYVFDLSYAKELKPFFLLLEKFAAVETHRAYSTLSDLHFDLNRAADCIAEAALPVAAPIEYPPAPIEYPPAPIEYPPAPIGNLPAPVGNETNENPLEATPGDSIPAEDVLIIE